MAARACSRCTPAARRASPTTPRSASFRHLFPAAGDDFKIMGLRNGAEHSLIDCHVRDAQHYFAIKDEMIRHLRGELPQVASLVLNALDDPHARSE